MNNPLFEVEPLNALPAFSKIKPSHVEQAVKQVISDNKKIIETLCDTNNDQDISTLDTKEIVSTLENIDNRLSKIWSPISHLNSVMNTDELREVYTQCLPLLSDYSTEVGQHKGLYTLIKKIADNDDGSDEARATALTNQVKSFELSGIALSEEKQQKYKKLSRALTKLTSQFSDNVLDATNAWTKVITEISDLKGLPESAIDMAKSLAEQREKKDWLLTLDFPIMNAVMTYAESRDLRKELYKAYSTKASDQGNNKKLDNSNIMAEIISTRTAIAKLLGFDNYAEQSLYRKMADDPEQVINFLNDLLAKAKPQAENEIKHLQDFARKELKLDKLQAWDTAFVREKLKQKELQYSEEDIKPWFSVEKVLAGLYDLVEQLYNCTITLKKDIDVWHKDVRFYEIHNKEGEHIASFYLDLYARQHKRGGAWMGSYCGRYLNDGKIQIPVAYLTCNSSTPSAHKEALFTHDEVITLFHEFGHGLHHMLTKVDYLDVSGISGVEWDAVELPSQFMENWCWQRESLDLFAKHYETGEVIPEELFDKMLKTRHYNSGLDMLRQLEFALFDMRIYMDKSVKSYDQITTILKEVRSQTSVLPTPEFNRFQNSFAHIFAGGYAAGYFSYKWAEVLSADAFSKFEETGLFNKETAQSFLTEVLEKGGARPAKVSFKAFRGREPDISALLKHSGIHASA